MNPLTLVILGVVALFFYNIGSTFLAFLVLIVLAVMMLSSTRAGSGGGIMGGGGGHANPYVIHQQGATWPSKAKFEFRPNYPGDPDGDEWISGKTGQWMLLFGKATKSLLGLGKSSHHDKFYQKYLDDEEKH